MVIPMMNFLSFGSDGASTVALPNAVAFIVGARGRFLDLRRGKGGGFLGLSRKNRHSCGHREEAGTLRSPRAFKGA